MYFVRCDQTKSSFEQAVAQFLAFAIKRIQSPEMKSQYLLSNWRDSTHICLDNTSIINSLPAESIPSSGDLGRGTLPNLSGILPSFA